MDKNGHPFDLLVNQRIYPTKPNKANRFHSRISDFPNYNSTYPTKPNEPIVTLVHSPFRTFLRYKSTHPTRSNKPIYFLVGLSFQTFPSYSRNWGLFGLVDPILREACQEVSTISRSKFEVHQPPSTHLKPISPCRY
jgi:hypothetical protein